MRTTTRFDISKFQANCPFSLTQEEIQELYIQMEDQLLEPLLEGKPVKLKGITLHPVKSGRTSFKNPKTGEKVECKERMRIKVTLTPSFKQKLNRTIYEEVK